MGAIKRLSRFAAVGASILIACAGNVAAETYQVGVEASFPPWSFVENGEFKGIAVDAVREIAREKGFELELHDLPWTSLIPAVTAGKLDILATGMFVTKERNEVIDYAIPWWETNDAVFTSSNSTRSVASALCCGARIGTQSGSGWETWINNNLVGGEYPTQATLQVYDDPIAAAADLKTGRLDSVVVSTDIADDLIAKGQDIKVVGTIMTRRPWAIAVGRGDPKQILAKLNSGIVDLYKSGKWAEIVHHYLPTAPIPPIPGYMSKEFRSYSTTPPGIE